MGRTLPAYEGSRYYSTGKVSRFGSFGEMKKPKEIFYFSQAPEVMFHNLNRSMGGVRGQHFPSLIKPHRGPYKPFFRNFL